MIHSLYLRLLSWARRQTQKRRSRQRVAELEHRLKAFAIDAAAMQNHPPAVQQRMQNHHDRLVKQIENAKRLYNGNQNQRITNAQAETRIARH